MVACTVPVQIKKICSDKKVYTQGKEIFITVRVQSEKHSFKKLAHA